MNPSSAIAEVLSHTTFRRIWAIGAIIALMRWLDALVLGVFVFELTGSASDVALVFFFRFAPQLLLGLFIGTLADRISRRRLLIISLVALTTIYASVALLIATDLIRYWHIVAAVFAAGIFITTEFPVRRAMIGDIMPAALLGRAASIDIATTNIMRALGPLSGGLLLQQFGVIGAYLLAASLFFIAFGIAFTFPAANHFAQPPVGNASKPLAELIAGLRYIRSNDTIVGVMIMTIVLNMYGFSYISLISPMALEILKADPVFVGILISLEGTGAVLGSFMIAAYAQPRHYLRIFFFGSAVFLSAILAFSASSLYWLSAVILFTGGFGIAGFSTMQTTILISSCDPAMRGRVMGTLALCIGAQPLGALQIAYLTKFFDLPMTLTLLACSGLIGLVLTGWRWSLLYKTRLD